MEPPKGPAWVVLPTYNEADNIEPFVAAARSNLPADAQIGASAGGPIYP